MFDISSLFPLLQAPAPAATATGGAGLSSGLGMIGSIAPLLLIVVVFWFFVIRPQSKKQKETEKMLKALTKGDKVVTIGGIHGTVTSVKDSTVIVKVDENCKLEFLRSAIASVVRDKAPEATPEAAADSSK